MGFVEPGPWKGEDSEEAKVRHHQAAARQLVYLALVPALIRRRSRKQPSGWSCTGMAATRMFQEEEGIISTGGWGKTRDALS